MAWAVCLSAAHALPQREGRKKEFCSGRFNFSLPAPNVNARHLKKGVQGHRTVGAMLRNAFCFCSVSSSCPLFHKIVSGKTGEGFQKDLQDVIHVFAHYLKDVLYAQGGPLFVPAVVVAA